jgi:hypothetical protein
MVKKRLFAAASSALTLVFFFGLLIFRFAMIFILTDEELVKGSDL